MTIRLPHAYVQNTRIIHGVPRWLTERELLDFLETQGDARRNIERPNHTNLELTRHVTADYTEPPPRCFKRQRFGHVAKFCRGEQCCKRCSGSHDFKMCRADFTCANCCSDHPASYSGCPFLVSVLDCRGALLSGKNPTSSSIKAPCTDDIAALARYA